MDFIKRNYPAEFRAQEQSGQEQCRDKDQSYLLFHVHRFSFPLYKYKIYEATINSIE